MSSKKKKHRISPTPLIWVAMALMTLAAFWTLVMPRLQREERYLVSPIKVTGVPEGYVISRQSQTHAKIRIIGKPSTLDRSDLFRLQVSIPDHPEADGVYPIISNISGPSPAKILAITPAEIHIRLAHTATRELPVVLRLEGEPAPGFRLGRVTIIPATTQVSGPLDTIQKLGPMSTAPIPITHASTSIKRKIPLEKSPDASLTITPELFTVSIEVVEILSTVRITGVSVTTDPTASDHIITPKTVDIEVSGPARLMAKLKRHEGIRATISTRALAPGVFVRRAAITLPEGVTLIGAHPELFTVTILPGS